MFLNAEFFSPLSNPRIMAYFANKKRGPEKLSYWLPKAFRLGKD